jgi:hypothetical protein
MATDIEIPVSMHIETAPEAAPVPQPIEAQPEVQERQKSARDEAMERILAAREDARHREMQQFDEVVQASREDAGLPRVPPPPAENDDEPPAPPAAPVAAPAPAPLPVAAAAPTLHRIDLGNGHVVSVDDRQLSELARMGALANVALSQVPQQRPEPQPQPAQQFAAPTDKLDEISNRISFGSPDDVKSAVRELYELAGARQTQAPIDPNRIVLAAKQETMAQIQLNEDLKVISNEFPVIAQSKELGALAAVELSGIRNEDMALGRPRSNLEAYREACKRVDDKMRGFYAPASSQQLQSGAVPVIPASQAAQQSGIAARMERKRAAPSTPTAASAKAQMDAGPAYLTGSAVVSQMRKQRGLMPMN